MKNIISTAICIGYIEGQFSINRMLLEHHAERYLKLCNEINHEPDEYIVNYITLNFKGVLDTLPLDLLNAAEKEIKQ